MEKLKIIDISDQLTQNSDDVLKTMLETYEYEDFFYALESFTPSQKMWAEIIIKYPSLIEMVPAEYVTDKMCQYVLKTHCFHNILRHIPKRYRRNESFLAECALESDSLVLEWITEKCPKDVLGVKFWSTILENPSKEILRIALERKVISKYHFDINAMVAANGTILGAIPAKQRTLEMCSTAIKNNGLSLQYVPKKMRTEELCLLAMAQNPCSICFVPVEYWNEEAFQAAIVCAPNICAKAPKQFLKNLDWETLAISNWRLLEYAPKTVYRLDLWLDALNTLQCKKPKDEMDRIVLLKIFQKVPADWHDNYELQSIERRLGLRKCVSYYFDDSTNQYCVWEKLLYSTYNPKHYYQNTIEDLQLNQITIDSHIYSMEDCCERIKLSFDRIQDFCDYCGITLDECPMEIQLSGSKKDFSFYDRTIGRYSKSKYYCDKEEACKELVALHDEEIYHSMIDPQLSASKNDTFRVFYVTDIHLVHKLVKHFPLAVSQYEIYLYLKDIVKSLIEKADITFQDVLLVGGDVSSDFEIAKMFYSLLAEEYGGRIIVILGNHELWPFQSVNEAYAAYGNLFEKYKNIVLLNGMIVLPNAFRWFIPLKKQSFSVEQIIGKTSEEIKRLTLKSPLSIIGGIGFSANNPSFNAENGEIYQQAVNKDEDIRETEKFNKLYNLIHESCKDNRVLVFTHMPMCDWSCEKAEPNWIYLNGHTHRNVFICNESQTLYADNQIGYYRNNFGLRSFPLSKRCDIFRFYADGIYSISRHQYLEFNRYNGVRMSFNRTEGRIVMLKRNNYYMFLYCPNDGGLYLLKGGLLNTLSHEIGYYYSNIPTISEIISNAMSPFQEALKKLSDAVCAVGGEGTIHGNIVDIDFYNHIMLDPDTGKVIPYFAIDIWNRKVYPNIQALLREQLPSMYINYLDIKSASSSSNKEEVLSAFDSTAVNTVFLNSLADSFFEDQWFGRAYKLSRLVRSMQYLTDVKIIRVWNDELLVKEEKARKKIEA